MIHQRLKLIKRIIISIGHDPKNVGAVNNKGEKENTLATDIAKKAASYLLANGVAVWLMPDLELSATIKNLYRLGKTESDLGIEIHKDSTDIFEASKMERRVGLYYLMESAGAGNIAKTMVLSMIANGAHNTSWTRVDTDSPRKRLAFVRDTKMLSYIYEAGFIEGNNMPDENEWYAWTLTKSILTILGKPIINTPINYTTIPPIF